MKLSPGWLSDAHKFGRHWAKCAMRHEYRALAKILRIQRYRSFSTDLLGVPITAVDSGSFVNTYAEIFQRELYRFHTDSAGPKILDCGANIGLAVIYFKRLYPHARITA